MISKSRGAVIRMIGLALIWAGTVITMIGLALIWTAALFL
jgi:hypothetical protein